MNSELIDQIRILVAPSLSHCGVDLVDLQWSPDKRHGLLRLTIDKSGGVSLDDCERVSSAVGAVLDAFDPIAGGYSLEVSSPGAERPLRNPEEWRAALGRRVNVRRRAGSGETILEGRLVATAGDHVDIEVRVSRNRQALTSIPFEDIVAARIVVDI